MCVGYVINRQGSFVRAAPLCLQRGVPAVYGTWPGLASLDREASYMRKGKCSYLGGHRGPILPAEY